ncbi:MAG TPA: helix-turn-helix domain-containing protein [Acidimicrobiales bacterium]|nr:helix-turn-helix domain-containing protein [Acidimicrobiales bacterium]
MRLRDVVVVEAGVAAQLFRHLPELEASLRRAARRDGLAVSPGVARVIAELRELGAEHEARLSGSSGTAGDLGGFRSSGSPRGPVVTLPVVSVATAAAALGVSPRRVRQLADAGRLPGTKSGRAWTFTAAAVAAFKEAHHAHS